MGMKPRVRKPKFIPAEPEPENESAPELERTPIPVTEMAQTPRGWHALHEYLHEFEEEWSDLTDEGRDSFLRAMSLFAGGMGADAHEPQLALHKIQSLVRCGFVNYDETRNDICQAVVLAHVFEQGDQTIN